MSFNAIRENKILAKTFGFTVVYANDYYYYLLFGCRISSYR